MINVLVDPYDDLLQVPPVTLQSLFVDRRLHVPHRGGAGTVVEGVERSSNVDTGKTDHVNSNGQEERSYLWTAVW